MLSAFLTGLATGLGLIVAIGAQNAFVIRQGVLRRHVFAVATICFLADAALIAAGVAGLGSAIAASPWLTNAAAWGGAAYLAWFGGRAFWNGVRTAHKGMAAAEAEMDAAGGNALRTAIVAALGFTFLNPHVYLDTVVLMGGIGAQYPGPARLAFVAGGATASFFWFYGIGFGASLLSPLFRKPAATRALDLFVAAVMFTVAAMLATGVLGG